MKKLLLSSAAYFLVFTFSSMPSMACYSPIVKLGTKITLSYNKTTVANVVHDNDELVQVQRYNDLLNFLSEGYYVKVVDFVSDRAVKTTYRVFYKGVTKTFSLSYVLNSRSFDSGKVEESFFDKIEDGATLGCE